MRRFKASLALACSVFFVMIGCGGELQPQLSETKATLQSLQWFFQCPTSPTTPPSGDALNPVVVDDGPHLLSRERLVNVPIKVSGKVCEPREMKRDMILAIDMSGSMSSSDPLDSTNKTCGRLKAVNLVLDQMDWQRANVAILMWDDYANETSSRFFNNKTDLINDLTGNAPDKFYEIICAAIGGTAMDVAISASRSLFQTSGREFATKELFLLSDGEPNDQLSAEREATVMKTQGVTINGTQRLGTIATVFLGDGLFGGEAFMRDRLASKDVGGAAIHAQADHANDLAVILAGMASNNKLEGSNLKYGPTGGAMKTIDVKPYLRANFMFELPPFVLDFDGSRPTYDVKFEYWDTHFNRYTTAGKIKWRD